mmetsp:Transcript_9191/g.24213  ORF Transcript_9191/g.24213 Transcript_9191/m.24213 type:complete len:221 (-) Transcript_9191:1422-2084(-)
MRSSTRSESKLNSASTPIFVPASSFASTFIRRTKRETSAKSTTPDVSLSNFLNVNATRSSFSMSERCRVNTRAVSSGARGTTSLSEPDGCSPGVSLSALAATSEGSCSRASSTTMSYMTRLKPCRLSWCFLPTPKERITALTVLSSEGSDSSSKCRLSSSALTNPSASESMRLNVARISSSYCSVVTPSTLSRTRGSSLIETSRFITRTDACRCKALHRL